MGLLKRTFSPYEGILFLSAPRPDSRGRDTAADVARHEERARQDLQREDAERERALKLEQERVLKEREAKHTRSHGLER